MGRWVVCRWGCRRQKQAHNDRQADALHVGLHAQGLLPLLLCVCVCVSTCVSTCVYLQMNYNNKANLVGAMLVGGYDKLHGGQVGIGSC